MHTRAATVSPVAPADDPYLLLVDGHELDLPGHGLVTVHVLASDLAPAVGAGTGGDAGRGQTLARAQADLASAGIFIGVVADEMSYARGRSPWAGLAEDLALRGDLSLSAGYQTVSSEAGTSGIGLVVTNEHRTGPEVRAVAAGAFRDVSTRVSSVRLHLRETALTAALEEALDRTLADAVTGGGAPRCVDAIVDGRYGARHAVGCEAAGCCEAACDLVADDLDALLAGEWRRTGGLGTWIDDALPNPNYDNTRCQEPEVILRDLLAELPRPGALELSRTGHYSVLSSLCPAHDRRWPGVLVFEDEAGNREGDYLLHAEVVTELRKRIQDHVQPWY